MKDPIRISKRGTITLDVLTLQNHMEHGLLSERDRAMAEAMLPGITGTLAKRILANGKTGNVTESLQLILRAANAKPTPEPGTPEAEQK